MSSGRSGTDQMQMGDVAVGFASGDVPELNVLSLPFLCTIYEQFESAIPAFKPVVDDELQKKFGVTVGMHWTMPPQNIWLNRPVSRASTTCRGSRCAPGIPEQVGDDEALGGGAVSITSAEVIPALERKVIDGAITSALSANDWRAFEIVAPGIWST